MEQRRLGTDGPSISVLGLGCWMFGSDVDEQSSLALIDEAFDRGIQFLDTANIYGQGASERVIGKALKRRRSAFFVATKVFGSMGDGPDDRGLSQRHVLKACDASLRRLDTDYIDLYQLHRPDPMVPIAETLEALSKLLQAGKIRAIGTSTFRLRELQEAQRTARDLGFPLFISEQPPYSLLEREVEEDVAPFCQEQGMGLLAWSPLAEGLLTGKYRSGYTSPNGSRFDRWNVDTTKWIPAMDRVTDLMHLAEEWGMCLRDMALAWLRERSSVTSILIGPRTLAHLEGYMASLEHQVSRELAESIDALVAPGTTLMHHYMT